MVDGTICVQHGVISTAELLYGRAPAEIPIRLTCSRRSQLHTTNVIEGARSYPLVVVEPGGDLVQASRALLARAKFIARRCLAS